MANDSICTKVSIEEANRLCWEDFVKLFGNVVEKAPYVASAAWGRRPFSSVEDLHLSIQQFLDALPTEGKEALFRFLPDLSGQLARRRRLGPSCFNEQGLAGLFNMTRQDVDIVEKLNAKYTQKFGFPFILCARENKVTTILERLRQCLANSKEREVERALREIKRISWYRLGELVQNSHLVAKL